MHEVAVIENDVVIDYRVCTCKIGIDHNRYNGKNIDPKDGLK